MFPSSPCVNGINWTGLEGWTNRAHTGDCDMAPFPRSGFQTERLGLASKQTEISERTSVVISRKTRNSGTTFMVALGQTGN